MKYIGKYLKDNVIVLICELVVVLLLGFICSFVAGGEPVWLAPVMAFVAYLLAELRFMMAYVATNARRDRDAKAAQQPAEELPQQPYMPEQAYMAEQPYDTQEDGEEEERPAAFFTMTAPQPAEPEQPAAESADESAEAAPVQENIDMDEEDEAVEALFAEYKKAQKEPQHTPAQPMPEVDSETEDNFSREVRQQLNQFMIDRKEQQERQAAERRLDPIFTDAEQAAENGDMTKPVFDDAPLQTNSVSGSVATEPVEEPERLETIEISMPGDDEDNYTMDDAVADRKAPVARDVLDIGEIVAE